MGKSPVCPESKSDMAGRLSTSKFISKRMASQVSGEAMRWASSIVITACRPLPVFSPKKRSMRRMLFCTLPFAEFAGGAFQFVGQISEQIGRAHLREDQVYERRVGFAQHTAEHGGDERLARARRPGQKCPAAAIFHGIAQLQSAA